MTQQTLVLIKPDGVKRNLIGEIISRIEKKGYRIVEMKKFTPTNDVLHAHYAEHEGKPFFEPLVEFALYFLFGNVAHSFSGLITRFTCIVRPLFLHTFFFIIAK